MRLNRPSKRSMLRRQGFDTLAIANLIQCRDWKKLKKNLQRATDTEQDYLLDPIDGLLPIHRVCQHASSSHACVLEVLQLMLQCKPQVVKALVPNGNKVIPAGSTPLHILTIYGFCKIDILRCLIDAYPDALTIRDHYGRTPLFHVVENRIGFNKEEICLMIDKGKGIDAVLINCGPDEVSGHDSVRNCPRNSNKMQPFQNLWAMDKNDRTPLFMAWDTALNTRSSSRWAVGRKGPTKRDGMRQEKAYVFLEHLYLQQGNEKKERFLLFHAALMFHKYLPVEIFEHAFDHYKDEINEIEDITGRTPLHIAASAKIEENTFLNIMDGYQNTNSSGRKNLSIQDGLSKEFVNAATTRDSNGRLPLFIALENGYLLGLRERGVIERLLDADPAALIICDSTTGLYPFMLAALGTYTAPIVARRKSTLLSKRSTRELKLRPLTEDIEEDEIDETTKDRAQLFTIYELLRKDPGVLRVRKRRREKF